MTPDSRRSNSQYLPDDLTELVERFEELVASGQREETLSLAKDLVDKGRPLRVLYIDVLTPVARHLGQQWEDDTLPFTTVTTSLNVLQEVLHELRDPPARRTGNHTTERRVLLARGKGEQHTLGILTLEEFFEAAGWAVNGGLDLEAGSHFLTMIEMDWYALAALSVGSETQLTALPTFIRDLRGRSKNQNIVVMVGGPMFADGAHTADDVGADLSAINAELAVEAAEAALR